MTLCISTRMVVQMWRRMLKMKRRTLSLVNLSLKKPLDCWDQATPTTFPRGSG